MKTMRFILVFNIFVAVFCSCSTDVDLYAEYKDVPVIYCMLNPRADTNYLKITRAFCGTNEDPINANEVALIYDSSNYPCKLDARIIELESRNNGSYEPTGREIVLDTMTLHNKQEGTFYSPDQLVYYTTEPFNAGAEGTHYKYRLMVIKPDGDTLTALTGLVGNEEFEIITNGFSFEEQETDAMNRIMFRADGVASLYEVSLQFNYREQLTGQQMKYKNVNRTFGVRTIEEFQKVEGSDNAYFLGFSANWLFNALANAIGSDTVVDANHPNVVRYFDNLVVSIDAAGEDLYYYYLVSQANQSNMTGYISLYSNITGGQGLFSSRTQIKKNCRLSSRTLRSLYGKSSWGFVEQ